MKKFETTKDVDIPLDPFSRIIGQPEAVEIARIAASQKVSHRTMKPIPVARRRGGAMGQLFCCR